mmetsp:Transcript_18912/g.26335  ORF Transcript_18912/g.26335 Transcript_18912/m.26335 type:complete len:171 (+) Transcript_18912:106-618(+)
MFRLWADNGSRRKSELPSSSQSSSPSARSYSLPNPEACVGSPNPSPRPYLTVGEERGDELCGDCSICLEELKGDSHTLPCDHKFHSKCVSQWLDKKPTCPLCRRIVQAQKRCSQYDEYIAYRGSLFDTVSETAQSVDNEYGEVAGFVFAVSFWVLVSVSLHSSFSLVFSP